MSAVPTKAVFLSYASQDAAAAKRICDTLRASGVEVWFDTDGGLEHGDEWDAKIRKQVKECVLFIAVISASTQAREEGYFRIEWDLAAERARGIASGVAFILPVIIDDTREPAALVPDRFRSVQWTKLPGGVISPEIQARFLKLWEQRTGVKSDAAGRDRLIPPSPRELRDDRGGISDPALPRNPFPVRIIAAGVFALAAIGGYFALRAPPHPPQVPPPATEAASSPVVAASPTAAPVWPHDPELVRALDLINSMESTLEDFRLADEISSRALEKAPTDPDTITVAARVNSAFLTRGFDFRPERTATAKRLGERAVQLSPNNPEALLALAAFLQERGNDLNRSESLMRRACELAPNEPVYWRQLVRTVGRSRPDDGLVLAEQNAERFPHDALAHYELSIIYRDRRQWDKFNRELDATIAIAPLPNAINWKARYAMSGDDLSEVRRWLDRVPARAASEERTVITSFNYAFSSGDYQYGLDALDRFAEPWFNDRNNYSGPASVPRAMLLELQGKTALARQQFEMALSQFEQHQKEHPTDLSAQFTRFWILLGLGRMDEARAARRISFESLSRPFQRLGLRSWWFDPIPAALLVDERGPALELLREAVVVPESRIDTRRRFLGDPRLARWHDDAEILALLAEPKAATIASAPTPPVIDQKSVAVLAFANLSEDKENEYFSDGISEELLNVLAKIPDLKVAARTSAFYFKGKDTPMPEIARQLSVAYVVEGSVRKQGSKVRITAQLIKAADGFHVWSDTFTREVKDVFAVQDEIAGLIAHNISPVLNPPKATTNRTFASDAVQEYLAGRAAVAKASMKDLRDSVAHFERAVAVEPKFTAAWVELAGAHTRLGRWNGASTLQSWQSARAAIDQALALEPDSPEVLLALGWIQRTAEWNWAGAERSFRRALELRPTQPDVLGGAAVLLFNIGQKEEAFRLGQQAARLDPLNPSTQIDLSLMFFMNEEWPEAERQARRALALAPDGGSYHSILSWSLIHQKRYADAETEIGLETDLIEQANANGLLALARGQNQVAREMVARLEKVAETTPDSADLQQSIATLYTGLGDKDKAFAALEKARVSRDPSMSWLRNSGYFAPLFSDPRWPALLHEVGLSDEQLQLK